MTLGRAAPLNQCVIKVVFFSNCLLELGEGTDLELFFLVGLDHFVVRAF